MAPSPTIATLPQGIFDQRGNGIQKRIDKASSQKIEEVEKTVFSAKEIGNKYLIMYRSCSYL
jgi:hypothetical protein